MNPKICRMLGVWIMILTVLATLCAPAAPAKAAEEFGNGNAQPSVIEVTWKKPSELLRIERKEKECILYFKVVDTEVPLYLSFPSCGGIRLHTDLSGYFEPEDTLAITYEEQDDQLIVKQESVSAIVHLGNPWSVCLKNAEGERIHTLYADCIQFGYQGNTLKKVMLRGAIGASEQLFGLGERFNGFSQIGEEVLLWNQDSYQGLMNYDGNKTWGYKNVPILYSSKGYSLFFNSTYAARADIGGSDTTVYSLDFNGPKFDVYFWLGTPQENLVSYTALTGRTVIPPKWALQFSVGAGGQVWDALGKGKHIDVMSKVLAEYKRLGTPVISLFGEQSPQYDAQAYQLLRNNGAKMIAWYWSAMGIDDMYKYDYSLTPDTLPKVVKRSDPSAVMQGEYIDFSNPSSVGVISGFFSKLWDWGLQGCMVDFGDNIFEDSTFYNGMTGDEMHNFYAYLYNKGYHDAWSERLGNDFILFSRSGCAGSQTWMGQFAGDHPSTLQGLRQAISGGLSASTAGFSLWGSDIGGYGFDDYPPSPDCYMRWLQFGTFSPLMRTHGTSDRNPWSYGTLAEKVYVDHYWLRENILDIVYSGAISASKNGISMIQPLYMAYPDQPELIDIEDQYLFCDVFLACPVVSEAAYARKVVFPAGNNWVDLWTGAVLEGGQTLTVPAPQERMPVYVKAGAVLPVQVSADTLKLTDPMLDGAVSALLVAAGTGDTTFYLDEGTAVGYSASMNNGVLRIQNTDQTDQRVIIAYGVSASAISVDGAALSEQRTASAGTPGFCKDVTRNRTVITLSEGAWKELTIYAGEAPVNLAAGRHVSSSSDRNEQCASSNAVDGAVTSAWKPKKAKGEWITVDLGETQEISNVILKWTEEYADHYVVELSVDGKSWEAVAQEAEGVGGIDTLAFNPKNARYVRVRMTENAKVKRIGLYDVQVYAGGAALENQPSVEPPQRQAGKLWPWIAAGITAAAAVGAATVLLIRKKRKSDKKI